MNTCIPLPVGIGHCTGCRADVAIDERGRCPVHQTLAIWPAAQPRPREIVTPNLALIWDGESVKRSPRIKQPHGPGLHRVLPGGRR